MKDAQEGSGQENEQESSYSALAAFSGSCPVFRSQFLEFVGHGVGGFFDTSSGDCRGHNKIPA